MPALWLRGKEPSCQGRRCSFNPMEIPWGRAWQPTPLFLKGKSHGQRSLASYNPWGCKESDTNKVTEHAGMLWMIKGLSSWQIWLGDDCE